MEIRNIAPGVTLRCFRDTRFKQGCLSIQFLRPVAREENSLNALLPAILLRGCKSAPDLRQITFRLDDLYGASIGALVRQSGDYQTTGLSCSFMDDRFAMGQDQVMAPAIGFLRELLLEPVLENGAFSADFVDSEKKNLISAIASRRNDKRLYASDRLAAIMGKQDSYGIPRLGTVEQVQAITAQSAYDHYQRVLKESEVHIFYAGSADADTVTKLVLPIFQGIARNVKPLPEQGGFRDGGGEDVEETMEVSQGKLAMGFTTPIIATDPRFGAMKVLATVLGAGMSSKLFTQVREKQSLCYDIGAAYYSVKGILTVSAGIDADKKEAVCNEARNQLQQCVDGNITDQELQMAKELLCNSLRGVHDSPAGIEGYYATGALSGQDMTPAQYMQAVEQVTREQVQQAAATVQFHSRYFLKGVDA